MTWNVKHVGYTLTGLAYFQVPSEYRAWAATGADSVCMSASQRSPRTTYGIDIHVSRANDSEPPSRRATSIKQVAYKSP